MSQASDMNRYLNDIAITAPGMLNPEASTTGDSHYAKQLNSWKLTAEPDSQGTKVTGGSPSTTGGGHYQKVENAAASATAATGMGGVPVGFTLNGNGKGRAGNRGTVSK